MRGVRRMLSGPAQTLVIVTLLGAVLAGCIQTDDLGDGVAGDRWSEWFTDVEWDTRGDYSRVMESGPYNVLPAERHRIEAHDGVMLDTAIWRPEVPENTTVPVILDIGPYYRDRITVMDRGSREDQFFIENMVTHGYAYGRVATRGTSSSEGCMEFFGPNEQKDVDTVLNHFGQQEWSNGKIALYGASYDGTTPWIGASFGNPYLATIVPVVGLTDVAGLMFRNGTSETRGPIMHSVVYSTFYGFGAQDGGPLGYRAQYAPEQLCEDFLVGTAEGPLTMATGDVNREYWEIRDWRQRVLDNYNGSVYLAHGLQDWNVEASMAFPFMRQLEDAGIEVKMMLGQWGHDWPDRAARQESDNPVIKHSVRWDWAELLKRWFDKELKGLDVEVGPPVDVQDSHGGWRAEGTWPPLDIYWTDLHLGDGVLAFEPQSSGSAMGLNTGLVGGLPPVADQLWQFELGPVEEDFRFAGLPRLHASFTTTVPDANIMARLDAVDTSGDAMRVAWGVMNIRYHEGGSEPVTVLPGDTFVAKMEMFPADVVIPEGSKLVLTVYPNTLGEPLPRGPAPLTLHWGDGQSLLKLPVIDRDIGDGKYAGQS
jgi:predicted acyl esterase